MTRYRVRRYVTGYEDFYVEASSKAEAKRKVLSGEAVSAGVRISGAETTTMRIEEQR